MNKYFIKITSTDPFDYEEYTDIVTAYVDDNDPNLLWYDDAYGQLSATYLSHHPEAVKKEDGMNELDMWLDLQDGVDDYIALQKDRELGEYWC